MVNILGATKVPHFDAAVRAIDLKLTDDDAAFLNEPYRPHEIVGANKGMQVLKEIKQRRLFLIKYHFRMKVLLFLHKNPKKWLCFPKFGYALL